MPGTRFVYELLPGTDWYLCGTDLIVSHPDRPPKVVRADGSVEVLTVPTLTPSVCFHERGHGQDLAPADGSKAPA